jgi:hypothetical protein
MHIFFFRTLEKIIFLLFFNFVRLLLKITQLYHIFDAHNMLRKFSAIHKYKFCLLLCTHLEHRNYLLLINIGYDKKNNGCD